MCKRYHRWLWLLAGSVVTALLAGCASRVPAAPHLSLNSHGRIGIIQFSSTAQGELVRLATQKFIEFVQDAQPDTPFLELGSFQRQPNPSFLRDIGQKSGIDEVFMGNLDISSVKPLVNVSSFVASVSVQADVDATLTVKLYDTRSGATLWTRSASASRSVAQVRFSENGQVDFGAGDPEKAYGSLIYALVDAVTRDLRPRYGRGE
jgi:hypothetical protein